MDGGTTIASFYSMTPCRLCRDTWDINKKINSYRWHTHLENHLRIGEIFRGHACERSAKGFEGIIDAPRIVQYGRNPYIDVFGESRLGIKHHRMSPDDQIFNAVRV